MPEFEQAINKLPIDTFLSKLASSRDGVTVNQFVAALEREGYDRETIVRVIRSQLDAGTVKLGSGLRLYPNEVLVAAE